MKANPQILTKVLELPHEYMLRSCSHNYSFFPPPPPPSVKICGMENKTDLLCNTQNSNSHLVVEGKLWSLYHSSVPFLPAEELLCRALDSASKIHYVCGELSLERFVERMYFRFAYDHLLSSKRREERRFSVKSVWSFLAESRNDHFDFKSKCDVLSID